LLPPWRHVDTYWAGQWQGVFHPLRGARRSATLWQHVGTNWVARQPFASPLPVEGLDSPSTVSVAHHSSPRPSASLLPVEGLDSPSTVFVTHHSSPRPSVYYPPLGVRKFVTPWQYVQRSLVEYQPCVCLWPVAHPSQRVVHCYLLAHVIAFLLPDLVGVRTPCACQCLMVAVVAQRVGLEVALHMLVGLLVWLP
jgi:hypothetical protein